MNIVGVRHTADFVSFLQFCHRKKLLTIEDAPVNAVDENDR